MFLLPSSALPSSGNIAFHCVHLPNSKLLSCFHTARVFADKEDIEKGPGVAPYSSAPGVEGSTCRSKGKTLRIKTIILMTISKVYILNLVK